MRYPDDYRQAVLAVVNIEGDTDSTGAVTGNISGAMLGLRAVSKKRQSRLTKRKIVEIIANEITERTHAKMDDMNMSDTSLIPVPGQTNLSYTTKGAAGLYSAEFHLEGKKIRLTSFSCSRLQDNSAIKEAFQSAYSHWNIPFEDSIPMVQNDKRKFIGAILGTGPEDRNTFLVKLNQRNFVLANDRSVPEQILILGTDLETVDWSQWIPYWGSAKIFTQQGFLNYIEGNVDDNENDRTVNWILEQCSYFKEGFFQWPYTDVYPSFRQMPNNINFPEIGMLNVMGYHVGKTQGLPSQDRRKILQKIVEGPLPFVESSEYMAQWSHAKYPDRLKKLANCLATLARNLQHHDNDVEEAVSDYMSDLQWLKSQYYESMNFRFQWPQN